MGCYLHGLFVDDAFRHRFLARFRDRSFEATAYAEQVENSLDALADAMEEHLDIDGMLRIAREHACPLP